MRNSKSRVLILCLFGLFCTSLWASKADDLLGPAVKRLDYKFFYWLFDEEGLTKAYQLAQNEDFETGENVLFTKEMLALFKVPQRNWEDKLGDLSELWYLEKELKTLDPKVAAEVVQKWRYAYLHSMMDYMRARAGRKPVLKFMAGSMTSYNTNINRVNDDNPNNNTLTDKKDGQQMLLFNMKWLPLANNAAFSKENGFAQSFDVVNIHQFSHKENQVMLFGTESTWTHNLKGSLEEMSLAYRFQNFGLSGDNTSRDTHSKFHSHRLKGELTLKAIPLSGALKSTQSEFGLGYIMKQQLNDVDKRPNDKDARDVRVSAKQSLGYRLKDGEVSAELEYVDYTNDNFAQGDYDNWGLSLDNKNSFKIAGLKQDLRVSEQCSYRTKGWDDGAAPIKDEDLITLAVKASTRLSKSWDSYLNINQAWRNQDKGNAKPNAKQTEFTLGFIWSTP